MAVFYTGTGSSTTPSGNTAQRPATPSAGMFRFNVEYNLYEYYTPAGWVLWRM